MKKESICLPILFPALFIVLVQLTSCEQSANTNIAGKVGVKKRKPIAANTTHPIPIADAATILQRKQVPILCYHNIRDWKASDSKRSRDYIVPVEEFRSQMKMLADSGYHTISPDQLYNYLATGAELPAKPIMITFDDTDVDQFTAAKPELDKYGFKGVFFIMTVSLGKPNYMSKMQVKQLSDEGHTIGSHTYDHKNIKKFEEGDWATQIDKPSVTLQQLTGKPIRYFAYPFGLWDTAAIPRLQQRGFLAAFQLSAKRNEQKPLYTIRRIIVPGTWNTTTFGKRIKNAFQSN